MLTEEEARTKWCPMVRLLDGSTGYADGTGAYSAACNRGVPVNEVVNDRCIASDCAMWLWSGRQAERTVNGEWSISSPPKGWRYIVSYDDGSSQFERVRSDAPMTGYCGLAGRSEVT